MESLRLRASARDKFWLRCQSGQGCRIAQIVGKRPVAVVAPCLTRGLATLLSRLLSLPLDTIDSKDQVNRDCPPRSMRISIRGVIF